MPEDKENTFIEVVDKDNLSRNTSKKKESKVQNEKVISDLGLSKQQVIENPDLRTLVSIAKSIQGGMSLKQSIANSEMKTISLEIMAEAFSSFRPRTVLPEMPKNIVSEMDMLTKMCMSSYSKTIVPLIISK